MLRFADASLFRLDSYLLLFVGCLNTTRNAFILSTDYYTQHQQQQQQQQIVAYTHNERRKFILFVILFYYPSFTWASFQHHFYCSLLSNLFTMVIIQLNLPTIAKFIFFGARIVHLRGSKKVRCCLECAFPENPKNFRIPFHNFHFYSFTVRRWIECFMHEMNLLNLQQYSRRCRFSS